MSNMLKPAVRYFAGLNYDGEAFVVEIPGRELIGSKNKHFKFDEVVANTCLINTGFDALNLPADRLQDSPKDAVEMAVIHFGREISTHEQCIAAIEDKIQKLRDL